MGEHHEPVLRCVRQAEGGREGRHHPVRPVGEARRGLGVRREDGLRGIQRLSHAQRGHHLVVRDEGPREDWTNISGGMNNTIFDVEEDPENANVLYLGTDNGIFVTIDQGKTWSAFSTSMPPMTIRDLTIQKRDREMAIGLSLIHISEP